MDTSSVPLVDHEGNLRKWDVIQRDLLERLYAARNGNISAIARELGVERRAMQRRFHKIQKQGRGECGPSSWWRNRPSDNIRNIEPYDKDKHGELK